MKILIGVDDSPFSDDLVKAMVTQFRSQTTEALVLHVVGPPVPEMAAGYAPEMEGGRKSAHTLVERIATNLRHAGFKTETAVEIADVREGIIDAALRWGADLILVGSHGKRGLRRFLLGGTAEFVSRHAACSVEIIRKPRTI